MSVSHAFGWEVRTRREGGEQAGHREQTGADEIDEAYAARAMPDLGLEIEDFQAQTWRIEKWSQQPKRLVGPEFMCGGHKW
jgi:hypothetical protein